MSEEENLEEALRAAGRFLSPYFDEEDWPE